MSRRASASRAAAKLTESIKKDKQQDEEDGKQDISFEESGDEYTPSKKKSGKRKSFMDESDSEEESSLSSSKKRRPGPKSKVMTPAAKKRPGPKSMTNRRESKPATPKHNFSKEEVLKKLNKWKDPNLHRCDLCDDGSKFETAQLNDLQDHLKKYHKMTLKDYEEVYGTFESAHKCQFCNASVTQNSRKLEEHFSTTHPKSTLEEYFEEKILPHLPTNFAEVVKSPPPAAVQVKKEAGAVVVKKEAGSSSSLEVTRRLLRDDSDDEDAAAAADTAFGGGDLPPMPSKTSGDSDAESSASSILNKDENKNRKKDFCRLCGDLVVQDVPSLRQHYESVHGTERDKEVSRWSQKITYRACKVPGCTEKKADSLADFKRHVVSSHGIKISAYIDMYCPSEGIVDTMVYHACLICQKTIMHDSGKLAKHVLTQCTKNMNLAAYYKDHVVPSTRGGRNRGTARGVSAANGGCNPVDPDVQQKYVKWLYQCSWECPKCGQGFEQYCQLKFHMKSDHQQQMPFLKKGQEEHPMAKKSKLHKCLLCDTKIIHDNEYLGAHYTKVHEIGGLPYFEAHVLDENNEIIEDRY